MDDKDSPPGCEDLFMSAKLEPKINQVLVQPNLNTACIGLEYVVEISSTNQGQSASSLNTIFYMCLLCDRRVDLLSNILKHLESPGHRLKYLEKYFPRARALFQQADTCFEKWNHDHLRFMDCIIKRIESRKGRLKVSAFHRDYWDMKSKIFKNYIDNGIHLRETADLTYSDIDSPFLSKTIDDDVVIIERIQNNSEKKVPNKSGMNKVSPHSSSKCKINNNSRASRTGSEPSESLDEPKHKSKLEKKTRGSKKPSQSSSSSADSVSICLSPRKRSRSRDRSRSKSRSRSRRSRRSRSRSRSRSKDYSRSYYRSDRSASRNRERSAVPYYVGYRGSRDSDSYCGRGDRIYRYQPYPHLREHQLASKTRLRNLKLDEVETRLLWKKLDQELGVLQDSLQQRRAFYEKRPENHPQYAVEWKLFRQRRLVELKNEGKDPINHNFKPEWILFWHRRMTELDEEEIQAKKKELKLRYQLIGDGLVDGKRNASNHKAEKEETRDPVTFGWKKLAGANPKFGVEGITEIIQSSPSPSDSVANTSKDKIRASSNDSKFNAGNLPPVKPMSLVDNNRNVMSQSKGGFIQSFEPAAGSSPKIPVDVDILSVLRILVVLEDSLGRSLGPSITQLLSRALALERKGGPGSASKLLQNDPSCVDLLDTSKEKLKGLLLANMLGGVNADAARRAIENVTALLRSCQQEIPIKATSVEKQFSTSLDASELIKNLKAAGFLLEPSPTKNSNSSTLNNNNSTAEDQFTPTDLKTLIFNFKSLSASQQNDLVVYLGRLEARQASKNEHPPRTPRPAALSFLNRSTSPLSMKSRKLSNSIVNPTAPDPQPCLFPEVLKITGLTYEELKTFGVPLQDLYASISAASEKLKAAKQSPPVINLDIDHRVVNSPYYTISPGYQHTGTAFPRLAQRDAATFQHLNSFVETLPEVPKNTLQQTRDPRIYRKMQSSIPCPAIGSDYSNVQLSNQIYDQKDFIPRLNIASNQLFARLDRLVGGPRSPNYFQPHLDPRQNRYANDSKVPQEPNNSVFSQEFRGPLIIPISPVREQLMQPPKSSSLAARLDDSFNYFAKYGYQQ